MWWVKDPDRLKQEVAAVDALREQEAWLTTATPRMLKGLKFAYEFDVTVNGETYPFGLLYPAFFPETPPQVLPRLEKQLLDAARLRLGKSAMPAVVFLRKSERDETLARDMGADDLILEAFSSETLVERIDRVL
jgi:hypothetical protein